MECSNDFDIRIDFLHGWCIPLAHYLFLLCKDKKIKSIFIIDVYDKENDEYAHTLLQINNKYLDVSGIYSYDELQNHMKVEYDLVGIFIKRNKNLSKINIEEYDNYWKMQYFLNYADFPYIKKVANKIMNEYVIT